VTISRISSASAASDSVTLGTHASGDMILIFAYNDGANTAPSLPTGWLNINNATGSTSGTRIGYKIAQSASETSGTWTNADGLIAIVYRSDAGLVIPTLAGFNSGTSTTVNYSAFGVAFNRENVDQWMVGFASQRVDTNTLETAPTGMTNITSQTGTGWEMAAHDSNADANSFASANVTVTTSAAWRTIAFSIFEQPYPTTSGGGLFLPRGFDGGYTG
jgi:hypothetical protein